MQKIPDRSEINDADKWNIAALYSSDEAWERDFDRLTAMAAEIDRFPGTLTASAGSLYSYLQFEEELSRLLDRVFLYASMKKDEDNGNSTYSGMFGRVQSLAVDLSARLSFVQPELLSLDENTLNGWVDTEELAPYRRYFAKMQRLRDHTGTAREEELIALSGEVCSAPRSIFGMLNNVDIEFPVIKTAKGEQQLSHGNFIVLMESPDRRVRRDAFTGLYAAYRQNKHTFAATLAGSVKKDVFIAKARKFPSAIDAALYEEEIPRSVYDNLVETVSSKLPLFFRYLELRKQALGLDELHLYDIYTPLCAADDGNDTPYEQAQQTVLAGLSVLGEDYTDAIRRGFADGWVDVYENQGKTPGAYSSGVYDSMPYVLLNYQGNLNGTFTLAHELGHSMHSYYTNLNQPYIYSNYEIFVAEVASTVNETLLLLHLLDKEQDKTRRLRLVCHYLDEFRGTVFRQTMFAEFERRIHADAEAGKALSADYFCDVYYELNRKYFGDGVVIDDDIALEWARIPHFYRGFYVYKYATGFAAASVLAGKIYNREPGAVENYKKFLSGGSSADPLTLLSGAGVNMADPQSLDAAFAVFAQMLDELAELIK